MLWKVVFVCMQPLRYNLTTPLFGRWKLDTLVQHSCVPQQPTLQWVTLFLMESKTRNWMWPAVVPCMDRLGTNNLFTRLDSPLGGISLESSKILWRKHCSRMTLFTLTRINPDQGGSYYACNPFFQSLSGEETTTWVSWNEILLLDWQLQVSASLK